MLDGSPPRSIEMGDPGASRLDVRTKGHELPNSGGLLCPGSAMSRVPCSSKAMALYADWPDGWWGLPSFCSIQSK